MFSGLVKLCLIFLSFAKYFVARIDVKRGFFDIMENKMSSKFERNLANSP